MRCQLRLRVECDARRGAARRAHTSCALCRLEERVHALGERTRRRHCRGMNDITTWWAHSAVWSRREVERNTDVTRERRVARAMGRKLEHNQVLSAERARARICGGEVKLRALRVDVAGGA